MITRLTRRAAGAVLYDSFAVVRGNEVTNPYMVTEVYVQQNGTWKLGALSFTRLMTPGDGSR